MATILDRALRLRQLLERSEKCVLGAELVTTRGMRTSPKPDGSRASPFLSEFEPIHFVSITDNWGGSARIRQPRVGSGVPGKNVIIHVSCKDLNHKGLESRAWQLSSEGLNNVLAFTGDLPVEGFAGQAEGLLTFSTERASPRRR